MCNDSCLKFGRQNLKRKEIEGKSVLEVGSLDINGSLKPHILEYSPSNYIGIDIQEGPGVDIVCDAKDITKLFGRERFDLLISTEMLEHTRDWKTIISNFKNVLKPGGFLLITTRSRGSAFHDYPFDFWRFEIEDMKHIFSDFNIVKIEKDPEIPGVFLKAGKKMPFKEKDISCYELYSILKERHAKDINKLDMVIFKLHKRFGPFLSKTLPAPLKRLFKSLFLGKS